MKKQIFSLIIALICTFSTNFIYAQSIQREYKIEDDGYKWYKLKKIIKGKTHYGIANNDKTTILTPEYGWVSYRKKDKEFCVNSANGEYQGIFSLEGKWIIPLTREYNRVFFHYDNYYITKKDGLQGICNSSGNEIIPPIYKEIIYADNTFKYQDNNGKWISLNIDINGNKIDNSKNRKNRKNRKSIEELKRNNHISNFTKDEFDDAKLTVYEATIYEVAPFKDIQIVINMLLSQNYLSELIYLNGYCYYKEGYTKKALKELKRNKKLTINKKIEYYNPNNPISPEFKNISLVSLYRDEAFKHMKNKNYSKAIPIFKWFSNYDESPYSHIFLATCYYEQNKLKKAEKHFTYAYNITRENKNEELRDNISKVIEDIRILRTEKRQKNWKTFAQVTGVVLAAGTIATQAYMQSEGYTPNTQNQNMNYLLDPRYAMAQVQQKEYEEYLQFGQNLKHPNGDNYTFEDYQMLKAQAINESKNNPNKATEVSNSSNNNWESFYKENYQRKEKTVKMFIETLNAIDKTNSIYLIQLQKAKNSQKELRDFRLEAQKNGITIPQSSYETITIK